MYARLSAKIHQHLITYTRVSGIFLLDWMREFNGVRGCSTRNGSFARMAHLVAIMSFRAPLTALVEVDGLWKLTSRLFIPVDISSCRMRLCCCGLIFRLMTEPLLGGKKELYGTQK